MRAEPTAESTVSCRGSGWSNGSRSVNVSDNDQMMVTQCDMVGQHVLAREWTGDTFLSVMRLSATY